MAKYVYTELTDHGQITITARTFGAFRRALDNFAEYPNHVDTNDTHTGNPTVVTSEGR